MASRTKLPTKKSAAGSPAQAEARPASNVSVSTPKPKPIIPLLPWQMAYAEDQSRFKGVLASVQTGKSFTTSLEFALGAMEIPNRLKIMLSASERQSVELVEKLKMHTRAWDVAFEDGYFGQTEIIEHRAILLVVVCC
jgi:hypothetical protein